MALMQFKRISPEVVPLKPKENVEKKEKAAFDAAAFVELVAMMAGDGPPRALANNNATPVVVPTTSTKVTLYNDSTTGYGYKVWSIERSGRTVTVRWGKEHAAVFSRNDKTFSTETAAKLHMDTMIESKRRKGYRSKP